MSKNIYCIYERDGLPVFAGNSKECADFLGIEKDKFYNKVKDSKKYRGWKAKTKYKIFAVGKE